MAVEKLKALLAKIQTVRVAVVGDFCLDAYYFIDSSAAEVSVETGLPTRPVRQKRFSLGGAGNVVNNLAAMGVRNIQAFGITGDDLFGEEMRKILTGIGADLEGLKRQASGWDTNVYTKLYEGDHEHNRIDFGNFNRADDRVLASLLKDIESAIPGVDVVIINQQLVNGIHTEEFRKGITRLIEKNPEKPFIVDSRDYCDEYRGAIKKLNEAEGQAICKGESVSRAPVGYEESKQIINKLYERWNRPVFLTRGENGLMIRDASGYHEIPGLQILGRTDTVGAGDSLLAGIAAVLGTGGDNKTAGEFGNFAAGVTVQKLFQTGTATPAEIIAIGSDPDYRYRPELAYSTRRHRYYKDTEIEIISENLTFPISKKNNIRFAIFDHDGTISTLRQGWEAVMERMMVKSILGKQYDTVDETVFNRITGIAQEYIYKTTGVQTLVQMKGLIGLVQELGFVSKGEILSEHEYKAIYNRELLNLVEKRSRKYQAGELDINDCTIKNALPFLQALVKQGITLYLASGTDQEDVEREAELLKYSDLFSGGIYGAKGDISKEPKKIVLNKILDAIGMENASRIVTFGDGPVEIRETHKTGGLAIGVASDEVRRYGLNSVKRSRLVLAGADIIIPDFSQMDSLLRLLF
ncbi:MAG: PfkB family carbohydrate kinase [Spirochaetota bacterium]